jgi:hypothetical protein
VRIRGGVVFVVWGSLSTKSVACGVNMRRGFFFHERRLINEER